jgi:aconitate hydratase
MRPRSRVLQTIGLDLATVEPSVAGPKRPQDRVLLSRGGSELQKAAALAARPQRRQGRAAPGHSLGRRRRPRIRERQCQSTACDSRACRQRRTPPHPTSVKERFGIDPEPYLDHGSIVIAAITSCTNTSNPSVMVAAGLLAKKAVEKGLQRAAVGQDLARARLPRRHRLLRQVRPHPVARQAPLQHRRLRLHHLHRQLRPAAHDISASIEAHSLVAVSVLSGNRNFEGRINSEVRANYLMSPPLVVAYALAGRIDHDFETDPLGHDKSGQPVFLKRHLALPAGGR